MRRTPYWPYVPYWLSKGYHDKQVKFVTGLRTSTTLLTLLIASLLLVAGCGAEEEGEAPEGAPSATTAAEPETAETATLNIITSRGEKVEVEVEIATNDAERARGLMERTELAENAGMLFVYEEERQLSFWMKNTLIPLSVAYADSQGRIVDIQDMQPLDETPHPSAEPARYALEVNQGFFEEQGIRVGDRLVLPD